MADTGCFAEGRDERRMRARRTAGNQDRTVAAVLLQDLRDLLEGTVPGNRLELAAATRSCPLRSRNPVRVIEFLNQRLGAGIALTENARKIWVPVDLLGPTFEYADDQPVPALLRRCSSGEPGITTIDPIGRCLDRLRDLELGLRDAVTDSSAPCEEDGSRRRGRRNFEKLASSHALLQRAPPDTSLRGLRPTSSGKPSNRFVPRSAGGR